MKNHLFLLRIILPLFFASFFQFSSFGQHTLFQIESRADVLDNARPHEFFKIPHLRSKNGVLEVHLYVGEKVYNFNGDTIKMRTYTYEDPGETNSGNTGPNDVVGPWAPTLRLKKTDRLNVIVHNELPDSTDRNYLCSIDQSNTRQMNNKLTQQLKRTISQASIVTLQRPTRQDTLITLGNLEGADIETIVKDSAWIIHGRVPCPCGPGKKTCKKVYIDYPVFLEYNYGTKTNALRIYQAMYHVDNDPSEHDHNIPHDFSRTNMHMHGFHVSPVQDDIFREVNPTFSSYYVYDLVDHTPGTMWYHPHVHGATAIQVSSGMAGAVIIEDDFGPEDRDLELASSPDHERVLIFNQLRYDTIIGEVPDFNTMERSPEPKETTINGVVLPKMIIKPGEVQRWRMVHAGYRSTLGLEFPKEAIVYQIAVDGILFEKPRKIETLHLAPGNRSDVLIQFPPDYVPTRTPLNVKSIQYNPNCEYFETDPECLNNYETTENSSEEAIMQIIVRGGALDMKFPTALPDNGHKTIRADELVNADNPRHTEFDIATGVKPSGDSATLFMVNGKEFDGSEIPDILTVGDAEKWVVGSKNVGHPYHIHVNPFQVDSFAGRKVNPPIWKDVVYVTPQETAIIYAKYIKYWGDFVLHCHILAHEDEGMMQRVRIIRPKEAKKEE